MASQTRLRTDVVLDHGFKEYKDLQYNDHLMPSSSADSFVDAYQHGPPRFPARCTVLFHEIRGDLFKPLIVSDDFLIPSLESF